MDKWYTSGSLLAITLCVELIRLLSNMKGVYAKNTSIVKPGSSRWLPLLKDLTLTLDALHHSYLRLRLDFVRVKTPSGLYAGTCARWQTKINQEYNNRTVSLHYINSMMYIEQGRLASYTSVIVWFIKNQRLAVFEKFTSPCTAH